MSHFWRKWDEDATMLPDGALRRATPPPAPTVDDERVVTLGWPLASGSGIQSFKVTATNPPPPQLQCPTNMHFTLAPEPPPPSGARPGSGPPVCNSYAQVCTQRLYNHDLFLNQPGLGFPSDDPENTQC